MGSFAQAIRGTQGRLNGRIFWNRFATVAGWGLIAAASVVLLGKMTAPEVVEAGLYSAVVALLIGLAVPWIRGRRLSSLQAAVVLDRRGHLGGFPLLELAFPGNPWTVAETSLATHAVASIPGRDFRLAARRMVPGTFFLTAVVLIPQQENVFADPVRKQHHGAQREIDRLQEKVENAREKGAIPPPELEHLQKELAALQERTEEGGVTEQSWEGLDQMSERIERALQERRMNLGRALETSKALRESLEEKEMDEMRGMELRNALERAMEGLDGMELPEELRRQLEEHLQDPPGDGGNPEDFQDALRNLEDLLDRQRGENGQGEPQDDGPPGQGGVDRGPGHARLRPGDPSPELEKELKPEFLPRGSNRDPEGIPELFGLSFTKPKVDPTSSPGGTGTAQTESESRLVLRRNWTAGQQEAVKRYFEEDSSP